MWKISLHGVRHWSRNLTSTRAPPSKPLAMIAFIATGGNGLYRAVSSSLTYYHCGFWGCSDETVANELASTFPLRWSCRSVSTNSITESLSFGMSVIVVVMVLVMLFGCCGTWLFVWRKVRVRLRDPVCGCRYELCCIVLPKMPGATRRSSSCIAGMQAHMIPTSTSSIDM